jgi:NTP pyrophosphatase (non-canonical NTP hydrolase)
VNVLFPLLEEKVLAWAESRMIGKPGQTSAQLGKFLEEVDEVEEAFEHGNLEDAELEIGDVLVTLILLTATMSTNVSSCLDKAYDKIRNRTGKTINGVFVKSEDLPNSTDEGC